MLGQAQVLAAGLRTKQQKECSVVYWVLSVIWELFPKGRQGRQSFAREWVIHISDPVNWQHSISEESNIHLFLARWPAKFYIHKTPLRKGLFLSFIPVIEWILRQIFGSGNNLRRSEESQKKLNLHSAEWPGNGIEFSSDPSSYGLVLR